MENRSSEKNDKLLRSPILEIGRIIEEQQKMLKDAVIRQTRLNITKIIDLPRNDFFVRVKSIFSSIKTLDKDITMSFIHYNLPIHYAIALDTMHDINKAFSSGAEKTVAEDSYIIYFDEYTLDIIRGNWFESALLDDRKLIFDNILKAYDAGLYSVVVPAITVQMESIIKKKLNKKTAIQTNELRRIVQRIFSSNSFIDEITKSYYISVFLKGGYEDPNNRHSIIHGSVINYTEKIHAIKAIILFDTLLIQLEQTDLDKVSS